MAAQRQIACVLGIYGLDHAITCLASLCAQADEAFHLRLITDGPDAVEALRTAVATLNPRDDCRIAIIGKAEVDAVADKVFRDLPALSALRNGHPCWRKVTDPALLAADGEEVVLIDPDVYFPNRFTFEAAPPNGIALMWQRPNCLLPEAVVRRAFEAGYAMVDHSDIGVAVFRAPLDWQWLEQLVVAIGGADLPRSMHVESILWAAYAARFGGGYLDPVAWHCFANPPLARIARRLGRPGLQSLSAIDFSAVKAFHAGGVAKNWLSDAAAAGIFGAGRPQVTPLPLLSYQPFSRGKFERKFAVRRAMSRLGIDRLVKE